MNGDGLVLNKTPEVMVLDSNVLCAKSKFWTGCYFDAAFIVLPNFTIENGFSGWQIENILNLL